MYTASFQQVIHPPWQSMVPLRAGPAARFEEAPNAYITIEQDGVPHTRVDVYVEALTGPFMELISWGQFVVLGWNDVVHLIDPKKRSVQSRPCSGYFGHFYPAGDQLLVASATELLCLGINGNEVWSRGELGIDGVVVESISNQGPNGSIVVGQGEWDPPNGWLPFKLSLTTGDVISKK